MLLDCIREGSLCYAKAGGEDLPHGLQFRFLSTVIIGALPERAVPERAVIGSKGKEDGFYDYHKVEKLQEIHLYIYLQLHFRGINKRWRLRFVYIGKVELKFKTYYTYGKRQPELQPRLSQQQQPK